MMACIGRMKEPRRRTSSEGAGKSILNVISKHSSQERHDFHLLSHRRQPCTCAQKKAEIWREGEESIDTCGLRPILLIEVLPREIRQVRHLRVCIHGLSERSLSKLHPRCLRDKKVHGFESFVRRGHGRTGASLLEIRLMIHRSALFDITSRRFLVMWSTSTEQPPKAPLEPLLKHAQNMLNIWHIWHFSCKRETLSSHDSQY